MMDLLAALESSGFSMWVKESSTAYVAVLAFHTVGLAFLVGISSVTAMRILGFARSIPLEPMQDFFPLMYAGFWINLATGAVLMCLYPTDYLIEPTIYIKLGAVVLAVVVLRRLQHRIFAEGIDADAAAASGNSRQLAVWMMVAWLVATVAGRVMAYSMPTKLQTAAAVLVFAALAAGLGYALYRLLSLFSEPTGGADDRDHAGTVPE
jgi:hypothetical protein